MASGALCQAVLSAQGVFRVLVVIEDDRLPIPVVVTALALGAEIALVLIILLVTGDAGRRGALEFWISVAVLANDIPVFPGQREFCLAVIEKSFLPVAFLVTVGALGAQTAFVFVVFLVARKTIRRCVAELDLWFVAIAAQSFRAQMPALEHEVGELMVEGFFV